MKNLLITLICLTLATMLMSQSTEVPLGMDTYHILDRLEIKTGITAPFHSNTKAHLRGDVTQYALNLDTVTSATLTVKDRADLYYIFRDNNECLNTRDYSSVNESNDYQKVYVDSTQTFYKIGETKQTTTILKSDRYVESKKPILKHFYKTPANLWELNKKHFYIKLNPILNFKMAKAKDDEQLVFLNQRGVSIRGGIDDKVFFYTNILESQARFPDYVRDRIARDKAVPGAGLFKNFESEVFDIKNANDFLLAQGYVGVNVSKHVSIQLGHGRNFIGDGYRSMFLSDFGNNYFYLKTNARVWKFHYQTIFAELSGTGARDNIGDEPIPKKYSAMHHLSFNILDNLNVGLFEAVIFNRNNNFELQYLNPVIFYRTVEQALGSSDNAFVGMDLKWNFLKKFQLYGQLILDEFKFDELIIERRGWWANKYGIQLGLKYIDVLGIDHLDAQVEYNRVRPYTYTHRDSSASYTHYNQALAHPLGANFKEFVFKLRYQPTNNLTISPRIIFAETGADSVGTNWGTNLLLPHNTREQEFNNEIGQGIATSLMIAGLDISYQLRHNFYIDVNYFYRKNDSDIDALDRTTSYLGGGVRWNFANRNLDF